jgi:hypothetical protein
MTLLLTILEPFALMILEQPVLPAVMSAAEPAVADDALRRVPALLEGTAYLLGWHAAAHRQRHVQGSVGGDRIGGEG